MDYSGYDDEDDDDYDSEYESRNICRNVINKRHRIESIKRRMRRYGR